MFSESSLPTTAERPTPSDAVRAVQLEPSDKVPQLDPSVQYGDFRDALARDGYVVVPGVLDQAKCDEYIDRMHFWLESFGLGYKRSDSDTWKKEMLPVNHRGGLYNNYGVAHEQFMWDLRSEPSLIEKFQRLWGTDELLTGFDGCNISIPSIVKDGDFESKPWPHVDQSPRRKHLHCVQGILNFYPNGPKDGGLMILKNSRNYYTEFFDEVFKKDMPEEGWTFNDTHRFTDEQLEWLESRPGAEWHKVCAGPGDLILWDSRVCHYGAPTQSNNPRIAAYVCYKPASLITPDLLALKVQQFEQMQNSTHDGTLPALARNPVPKRRGFDVDPAWLVRQKPDKPPVLNAQARRFAGIESY
ncbi:hypothetical protein CYLTODRAFT_384793 [Cylindrobasidium torrendii FP15055 ss-10]|uniref:Phytanoyl-CoA dioxygenase n=1 Tax=Cylindrobasidium torrendii FP15055 ss-10 TaxID=1314674 RepID=A0A0D7AV77_9AGAR|nr:hypothetical protein CYLTODRAFT_384793 [Cylindrobasidium torrendii FP15055 ss-10]